MIVNLLNSPSYTNSNLKGKNLADNAIAFKGYGNKVLCDYIYKKAYQLHRVNILKCDVKGVENYFRNLGVDANFEGNNIVAYGCHKAAEIFRKLNFILPPKIGMLDFSKEYHPDAKNAWAVCTLFHERHGISNIFPPRSVIFNKFMHNPVIQINGKPCSLNWENYAYILQNDAKTGWMSTGHFFSVPLHEFAHNLHTHHLYSKFGSPEPAFPYRFNPFTNEILKTLKKPIGVYSDQVKKDISEYGTDTRFETFAEDLTENIIQSIDPFSLTLTKHPFSVHDDNPVVERIVGEIWEGVIQP